MSVCNIQWYVQPVLFIPGKKVPEYSYIFMIFSILHRTHDDPKPKESSPYDA